MNDLPQPVSFETALEKFTSYLKDQKRSSATSIAYRGDIAQLQKYLKDHKITQASTVQSEHLVGFITYLGTQNYTAKSISRKINSLKTFFKYLHDQGLLPANPARPLTHPKYEIQPPRILTPSEVKSLRDAIRLDIRVSAIVEILLQTGIRISELANIRLDDVKKNELAIQALENNPRRTIPLNRPAATAIQNYQSLRPNVSNDHLFVTKTGHPLLVRNIRTSIDRYFKKAGVKNAKVNDLRHTFIAHQLKNGVDPVFIHKHVGHKRLSSTQKYLDYITIDIIDIHTRLVEL
jgi:site-specific recombinase XerD